MTGPRLFPWIASALCVLVFVGALLATHRWLAPVRLDLTENRLYTLSEGADEIVRRLAEPVELELVFSRRAAEPFPALRAHGERVVQLLDAIAARSGGRVRVTAIDPDPYSEEEDRIAAAGLTPTSTGEGDPVHFGLIGRNSVDDQIVIPFLSPDRDAMLEYELVRLIAQLDDPSPPVIAVISDMPGQFDADGEPSSFIMRELARAFVVERAAEDFVALPDGADLLLLLHPPPLNDWQLYQIDQFLLTTGRAVIAVDPLSRAVLAEARPGRAESSGLARLLAPWGASVPDVLAADASLGLPVETDAGGGRRVLERQPLFIGVGPQAMDRTDVVSADLTRSVNFGLSGVVELQTAPGIEAVALMRTSPEGGRVPTALGRANPPPSDVVRAAAPSGRPEALAVRLSGRPKTSFPAGAPAPVLPEDPVLADIAREEIDDDAPGVREAQLKAEIVLIADADLFDDSFYIHPEAGTPLADNAAFILNAVDNLWGDDALVSLRSRAPAARPMSLIDRMRDTARERFDAEQTALQAELEATEARIAELAADAEGTASDDAASAELERFRAEFIDIRSRLRGVQREFRREIDAVEARLELAVVWAPPLLVLIVGVGVFLWRSRSRAGG